MELRPTIGLEVHTELKTQTKMFCASLNDPKETRPNVNICPVCMAHPGTLPVINKQAVMHVLRVGTALGGSLANYTEFDRKNYFYPDIPKGYQISQYKYPLVSGGSLNGVAITRVHLEEDTARSQHEEGKTLVDFNRAGVPLMELVTEPVMHDAQTAGAFARELQLLLRALGVSDANMEEGQMRIEANVSVAEEGKMATAYVEIKNISSFRAVEKAIEYEIARQTKVLSEGGSIVKETRGWDDASGQTFSQRKKESSHDYRYFPDPDLPKLSLAGIEEYSFSSIQKELPELPWERRARFLSLGIKSEDVEMFLRDEAFGNFFEAVSKLLENKESVLIATNYISSDIAGIVASDANKKNWLTRDKSADRFCELIELVKENKVSSRGAKNILGFLFDEDSAPSAIAEREELYQQSDLSALEETAKGVIEANPIPVAEFKAGKEPALQFLVGQGMRASKGSANPQALREIFIKLLR